MEQLPDNPKLFFNYSRHFYRSSSTIDSLKEGDELISNGDKKADILNSFFASVMTKEPDGPISATFDGSYSYTLKEFIITEDLVTAKLKKLKRNKASGPDGINVNILCDAPSLAKPLAVLFNLSIKTGYLPQDWRDAHISPIHKKGSRLSSNNYRPVSLTSQVCKLLERLILDDIWIHIKKNCIITCDQHGFQSRCSCITQLLECLNDWTLALDNKDNLDAIYLDFAKAFDSVPHKRLLFKLKGLGIVGKALDWIGAFLHNRRQRVILRDGTSRWENVISGIPQGSILGPVLFLLYINDMPGKTTNNCKLFADDSKLYGVANTVEDCKLIQQDLNNLSVWSRQWLLRFNASKCTVMRMKNSSNQVDYKYSLDGVQLAECDTQKDLGVLISNDLHPRPHITSICNKAKSRIGMFRRCFTGFPVTKTRTLYTTLVRPLLEYGGPTWSPWLQKDRESLEKVQRRCLRLCEEKIVLETLESRRNKQDLIETYKYLNHYYKTDPSLFFTLNHNTHTRGHSYKCFKEHSRTEIRKNFFSNRVINSWNNLPHELVTAPSANSFKRKLSGLLQQ